MFVSAGPVRSTRIPKAFLDLYSVQKNSTADRKLVFSIERSHPWQKKLDINCLQSDSLQIYTSLSVVKSFLLGNMAMKKYCYSEDLQNMHHFELVEISTPLCSWLWDGNCSKIRGDLDIGKLLETVVSLDVKSRNQTTFIQQAFTISRIVVNKNLGMITISSKINELYLSALHCNYITLCVFVIVIYRTV